MDDHSSTTLHLVSPDLSRMAGYGGAVYVTEALSDRLEVPEEWQAHYSYDNRMFEVLATAKKALAADSSPAAFKCVFPSNLTGKDEILDLSVTIDSDGDLVLDFVTVH